MSTKSVDLSSISSTASPREVVVVEDKDFPASGEHSGTESAPASVNLCLSLGVGLFGEDSKETLKRTLSLPVRSNLPENWAVESASRNAAFCRAMDKLKTNGQVPTPITDWKEGETSLAMVEKRQKKAKIIPITRNETNLTALDLVKSMPSVTTVGDGPKGKRIEGFLYKYKQGYEIEIMCICHGHVMSPLEFIKHAGGKETENPMKYINVLATTL